MKMIEQSSSRLDCSAFNPLNFGLFEELLELHDTGNKILSLIFRVMRVSLPFLELPQDMVENMLGGDDFSLHDLGVGVSDSLLMG